MAAGICPRAYSPTGLVWAGPSEIGPFWIIIRSELGPLAAPERIHLHPCCFQTTVKVTSVGAGPFRDAERPRQTLCFIERFRKLGQPPGAIASTRSMWPRFRPGRRVVVSPGSPVAIRDDVLVRLSGEGQPNSSFRTMVKELVRRLVSPWSFGSSTRTSPSKSRTPKSKPSIRLSAN